MATQIEAGAEDALSSSAYLFTQLDTYPWSGDQEFQGGLRAILGSVQDPLQVEHLTLRAKCYYYARKAGATVDFDGYKSWVESREAEAAGEANGVSNESMQLPVDERTEASSEGGGGMTEAPKPASFADICDMIAQGKPIPGIKDIPDTVLEGQASESSVGGRRKPWEERKGEEGGAKPSWMR
ncbi:hypothetical protein LTR08_007783 [Meristemomyces frigidus]|nr:hypothetical protein LTR08_007783 [Meristemomyces frigidus]